LRQLIVLLPALVFGLQDSLATADSVETSQRQATRIVDGVYTIRHKDPFPGWVNGNTTVIVGSREVFVVDSCQMPSEAREDIAQIRRWTDKPVRYLLNTHWHTDHNGGNHEYLTAFPSLAIIAHVETRKLMDGNGPRVPTLWLKDAATSRTTLNHRLETGKGRDGKSLTETQREDATAKLALLNRISDDAKAFVYEAPTLTFDQDLIVDLGGLEVEVKYLGRANTAGDAVVYLPAQRILATGDIVVHPIPYAFDGYPSDWIRTLTALTELRADTIVPGHGEILHDKQFIYELIDTMKSVVAQVDQQFLRNPDVGPDEVKKAVDLKVPRQRLAGNDQLNGRFFDASIADSFVELAYHERKQR